ncbi:MAG: hydroxysqualene dehydroxylase HpnE [Sphingomonadales bacterium]
MAAAHVHIVGAGLAGLNCAIRLTEAGHPISLYETSPQAGGRCRSYHDEVLGMVIDNGNHLLLSGNRAARDYIARLGSIDAFMMPPRAVFPFIDLRSGEAWRLRPNAGPLPWWMFSPSRRVAGSRARDYGAALKLLRAKPEARLTDCVDANSALYARFWAPLAIAALNTPLDEAAAGLLKPVLRETFLRGEAHCRPMIARHSLAAGLVDPALSILQGRGAKLHFGHRLGGIALADHAAQSLYFAGGRSIDLNPGDWLVLALPSWSVGNLLPDLPVPEGAHAIVNAHFGIHLPAPADAPLLGLVGGVAEWLFYRDGLVSATVSAADALAAQPAQAIAQAIWRDISRAHGLDPATLPPYRIVKEKRATFAQTPAAVARRPGPRTGWRNIALAGDWTDTGLPATIEGALQSGAAAAQLVAATNA